jgi:UDP-N-acetylmuramyl pentapeptide phosphotransferase/UDP-N-acetylglucosamine-1-phosphate transferase
MFKKTKEYLIFLIFFLISYKILTFIIKYKIKLQIGDNKQNMEKNTYKFHYITSAYISVK